MTMPTSRSLGVLSRAAAPALLVVLAGCPNEENGILIVRFGYESNASCQNDGVQELLVSLNNGQYTATTNCEDSEISIGDIEPRSYTLLVEGKDAAGDTVLDNLSGPTSDNQVDIPSGSTREVDVELGLTPARLLVNLSVFTDSGNFAQCMSSSTQVRSLRATASSTIAGTLTNHTFDYCEFGDPIPMPDADRLINGKVFNQARLQPLDASNNTVGPEILVDFPEPGPGKSVTVSVTCTGTMCTGSYDGTTGSGGVTGGATGGGSGETGGNMETGGMGTGTGGTGGDSADSTGA